MRRRFLMRFVSCGLLAILFAWLTMQGETVVRGQVKIGEPAKADEKKKDDKTKRPGDELLTFWFPYDRDSKQRLQAARDYLSNKDIDWNRVCFALQSILDAKSDSFFDYEYKAGDEIKIHRISVKTEANRIISTFHKDGLQFYQQNYGPNAAGLLKEGIERGYDLATLSDVSQRYFHTKAGAEATILLGTIYLDRGNFLESAYAFERLLARPESEEFLTSKTLFKAALALQRSGDSKHAENAKKVWEQLAKKVNRSGMLIGNKTYSGEQLKAEIDRAVAFITAAAAGEWAMRYGNAQHNAVTEGGPPFLVPSFKPFAMLYHIDEPLDPSDPYRSADLRREGAEWVRQNLTDALRRIDQAKQKPPALPAFFPLTAPDMLVFRSYDGIYAIATKDTMVYGKLVPAGEMRWFSATQNGVTQMVAPENGDTSRKQFAVEWWQSYLRTKVESLLFENPLLGALSHDGQNVYFVDDLAIPPPPVMANADFGGFQPQVQNASMGTFQNAVKSNILTALNIQNGKVVWTLGGPTTGSVLTDEEEDKTTSSHLLCQDSIFLGPPLPINGRLYVLMERNGRMRLNCFDPRTLIPVPGQPPVPALVWSQRLGEPNNRLPNDSIRRYQGAFLAGSEGIIVCPTNSGAVIGVDAMSRSLLWAHSYRKLDAPDQNTNTTNGRIIRRPFNPDGTPANLASQLPAERWRAAAPIIANGRVIFSAYDSNSLDCLDLRTGKSLWSVAREPADLYVGGVSGDKVVVVAKNEIRAYKLTGENKDSKPELAWRCSLQNRVPSGHGALGKSVYYVPIRADSDQKDTGAEIWAVNLDKGEVVSKTTSRKPDLGLDPMKYGTGDMAQIGAGNLVFHEGMVFSQSPWSVSVFPDLELKKAEMDRRLAANPKDPMGLRDRGELLMDEGKLQAAIKDFKSAAANKPPPEIERNLNLRLYQAYTELLRLDFTAAEPFLDEYKALCEVSLTSIEDPTEKARAADENLRRKGLYLSLLAKGREKQGRLVEAFDNYLAFANLGENKQLVPIFDEPNVLMRPDVWARGRIEMMVRKATDDKARKPLEERVQKEWEAVRETRNTAKLRDFVDVFGPYFPIGADARLMLADLLVKGTNDNEIREAQTHLAQLRATADDAAVRAKATELLARVMIRAGLLEDAVGLYAQLGQEFATVSIRENKTGADFFTDLLTDKRLLPYLEPSRHSWPGRVKVEQREPSPNGINMQSFTVEPEGELLPFYRRFRLVMDHGNGSGSWTLRVQDRLTGEERCKFPGMRQVQMNMNVYTGNNTAQPHRFIQASGHLLLVHLGHWAYCLDLAERKERWQYNLLGEMIGGTSNPTADVGADGETILKYEDGFMITLGRAAVMQPGYVCLLTRDELVALDPLTGKKLWARRNVLARTQVYGDSKYVLLVETGADKKVTATRLLRAVDGAPVEGFKDFTKSLASAKSYRVFGRHLLLSEGTGDAPKVARLYDTVTGTDVWKKEFDPKAVAIRTQNPDWVGFVLPNGQFTLLDSHTGKSAGGGMLDEKMRTEHLKDCKEATLLSDDDRFFLTLDKDPSATAPAAGGRVRFGGYAGQNNLRTIKVNGPMYCFERATGKRLWFTEKQLENQSIVLEQFGELPVVIAASQQQDENNQYTYRVVVIEKERGKLRFYRGLPYDGNFFMAMTSDPKSGKVELLKYNLRVVISPDDEAKTASATP